MGSSSQNKALEIKEGRITSDYLVTSLNGYRGSTSHSKHKADLQAYDDLYDGKLGSMFPNESSVPDHPLIENKLKNASHDLSRLASDAKGVPIFMREKEDEKSSTRAGVRAAIAETFWVMNEGPQLERKLYLDFISAGYAAVALHFNDESPYPQTMRLNPRFCYPEVWNGKLQNLLYVEDMKERQAARQWPELGLNMDAKETALVQVVIYYDDHEVVQAVCVSGKGGKAERGHITSRWVHELGCVPVAFRALESADDSFHGLFNQLGGPIMVRNKTIRLLVDDLEAMAHAPFEEKNIINPNDEPSPFTVYHHDTQSAESFMRRVQTSGPDNSIWGLLNYLDSQEASEAIQPPSRVGVVNQSIASGSFVASTQGTLSSAVKELQETCASLRVQADYIAFKIEARWMDESKPLWRAVGDKHAYKPSTDMGDWTHHKIDYGAAAGLNSSEADVRILQHLGAKLIDRDTARRQIDYLEDASVIQDRIDREGVQDAYMQRLVTDPNVPMSALAQTIISMGDGVGLLDTLKTVMPALVQAEATAAGEAGAPTAPEGGGEMAAEGQDPATEQMALEQGGTLPQDIDFAPPPLQQQIVRNPL